MLADVQAGIFPDEFENELLFPDDLIYRGSVGIAGIEAIVDESSVSVIYTLENTGEFEEILYLLLYRALEDVKVFENDARAEISDSASWISTMSPGEFKQIRIEFTEPRWGNIIAYNSNLFINGRATVDAVAQSGVFTLILPQGVQLKECVPSGYTVDVIGGRTKVQWIKSDFIPWTNPFNDLICTWEFASAPETTPTTTEEPEQPTDWMPYIIGGVVLLIILLIVFGRRRD